MISVRAYRIMQNSQTSTDASPTSNNPFDPLEDLPPIDESILPPPEDVFHPSTSVAMTSFVSVSGEAHELQGKHVPDNTKRSDDTSLRAFARFIVEYLNLMTKENTSLLRNVNDRSVCKRSLEDQSVSLARMYVFRAEDGQVLPHGHTNWTTEELQRVNDALIEFVTHYRTRKGEPLMNVTLRTYLFALQRAFQSVWGFQLNLLKGPVFANPSTGLMTVVDNRMRKEQATGKCFQSHKILSEEDIRNLYKSKHPSKTSGLGFLTRLIFDVAFMTGFRPSELWNLSSEDVTLIKHGAEEVWRISGRIGSKKGASKTQGGGWRYVNVKPKEVFIWNGSQLGGEVSVYEDLCEYMDLTRRHRDKKPSLRFFLAVNHYGTEHTKFFKPQNLGRNTFLSYIQGACKSCDVVGIGVRNQMTTHGLRGTVITRLFESGHADSSVALRSGHRDMTSLKSYQNLRGTLGKQQQSDILGEIQINRESGHLMKRAKKSITVGSSSREMGNVANSKCSEQNDIGTGVLSHVGSISGGVSIVVNNFNVESSDVNDVKQHLKLLR